MFAQLHQTLGSALSYEDFVIDEEPVELEHPEGAAETAVDAGEPALFDAEDFLAQVGKLLCENEKLLGLNEELGRARPNDEELEKFIKKFLPFFDSFERILYSGRDFPRTGVIENWLKAIESLYFRIKEHFEKWGLVEMKCIGKTVNFEFHDVVELKYSLEHPADTIIGEHQKGYIFRGKILRDAEVVVATHGK